MTSTFLRPLLTLPRLAALAAAAAGQTDVMRIGSVEIDRVVEWVGPIKTVDEMFPDTPPQSWTDDLSPQHWTSSTRAYRAAIQTWVIRSAGRTILVDTGPGGGARFTIMIPRQHLP